jgi:methenyltetrahydromethanopterin cyclohydrolase
MSESWTPPCAEKISVNLLALRIVKDMIRDCDRLQVEASELKNKATIIDCGVKVPGGYEAGELVTKIRFGGVGGAHVTDVTYGDMTIPTLFCHTNFPALIGVCQFVWLGILPPPETLDHPFPAWISGPAKALAQDPPWVFRDKINYRDPHPDAGVLVVQTRNKAQGLPNEWFVETIAKKCNITPENLYVIVTPSESVAGVTHVASSGVEDVFWRLTEYYNIPYSRIEHASGSTPLCPISPNVFKEPCAWMDDMIDYAGRAHFWLHSTEDMDLEMMVKDLVMENHGTFYGRSYHQSCVNRFKPADDMIRDVMEKDLESWLRIRSSTANQGMWVVAEASLSDTRTGRVYHAGKVDIELIKKLLRNPW